MIMRQKRGAKRTGEKGRSQEGDRNRRERWRDRRERQKWAKTTRREDRGGDRGQDRGPDTQTSHRCGQGDGGRDRKTEEYKAGGGAGRGQWGDRQATEKEGRQEGAEEEGRRMPETRVPSCRWPALSILDRIMPRAERAFSPGPESAGRRETATGPKATLSASPQNRASVHSWWGDVNSPPDSGTWLMFLSPWASALSFN